MICFFSIYGLLISLLTEDRFATEACLHQHHVQYKQLIMLNMKTREERLAWGKHGQYKGKVYASCPCMLFVESSLSQAKEIAKRAKKSVFCTETFTMINYEDVASSKQLFMLNIKKIFRPLKHFISK